MLEQKLMDITNEFKNNTSKLTKESLLVKYKDDEDFKKYLFYVLDSLNVYGIQDKKLKKHLGKSSEGRGNKTLFDVFEYLLKHNTGTDRDAQIVARFINSFEDEDVRKFLMESFTKKIKLGITAKTVNKVYPQLISEFNVMLADKFEDKADKIKGDFYVTLKLDGIRLLALKENEKVKFFTRAGQAVTGLIELEKEYEHLPDNMVYDGEVLADSPNNLSSGDLFRHTQTIVRKDGIKEGVNHILFDMLPLDEFKEGKSNLVYRERRKQLDVLTTLINKNNIAHIQVLPILYKGDDKNKVFELLDEVVRQGSEGVMINKSSGHYVTKRSDNLLKGKKMMSCDLRVIGYENGTGRLEGKLGALIVEYKGKEVKVGSGYDDSERFSIWKNRECMIGKIIEVQYFEESKNQNGEVSLRFPVFKGIRWDKDEPSYY